jgi:hypothetical protein
MAHTLDLQAAAAAKSLGGDAQQLQLETSDQPAQVRSRIAITNALPKAKDFDAYDLFFEVEIDQDAGRDFSGLRDRDRRQAHIGRVRRLVDFDVVFVSHFATELFRAA